ncbi:hypothetical protein SH1V18_11530 [Vallitalea longa]|uniref:Tellurite resistance methyltransferase TehB-like domain-containing protein n=1 Tax=Vallitalea longa TaxID=2936439 RepID=A0A9W5YA81_9FIRM|nr:class I SAM-dependent methyltransferase [Vallitalea longa]GKX28673.1 hypothetical protein SH1V18_11530 [Vallitalea longa]
MEYMGDRYYWNNKFEQRNDIPLNPEKSLVENIKYLKNGSVLDVACGDGRNSLFLLQNGFKVTGVDFSDKALERLKRFAKTNKYFIEVKQADLMKPDSLDDMGIYDNIVINHYRLAKQQIYNIKNNLSDKGVLFVCGFGYKHKVDNKIRECDLIQPEDFEGIKESFELLKYIENEDERGFFTTYIFRKK